MHQSVHYLNYSVRVISLSAYVTTEPKFSIWFIWVPTDRTRFNCLFIFFGFLVELWQMKWKRFGLFNRKSMMGQMRLKLTHRVSNKTKWFWIKSRLSSSITWHSVWKVTAINLNWMSLTSEQKGSQKKRCPVIKYSWIIEFFFFWSIDIS